MQKTESIASAAFILGFSVLLSRILGYGREMLLAYKFGASDVTDAFYAAFQIPDLLNYFLAGGALSITFIPLYNKKLAQEGEAAAQKLIATIFGTMGAIAVAMTAALFFYAEELVRFQFPKFDEETTALTVFLTRIVLPAKIFFVMGGIVQAVLLAHKNFYAAALSPLIYNILIIAGGYFLYPVFGVAGFAIGTLAGAASGPFLIPFFLCRRHIPIKVRIAPLDRDFMIYLALAAPLMLGQTLLTLDEWYGRWFGAFIGTGAVAHIAYARRLMQLPIAVIGQAVATAALPTLSKLWAEGRVNDVNKTLENTLKASLSLSLLAGAAMAALSAPLVSLLYRHGAFTPEDSATVSLLTALLALAIPGWITQQIVTRAFYARSDTWRPMILGTIVSFSVLPLYFMLSRTSGVDGIAMASAIAMSISALCILFMARIQHGSPLLLSVSLSFCRAALIAAGGYFSAASALALRAAHFPVLNEKYAAVLDLLSGGGAFGLAALAGVLLIGDAVLRDFTRKMIKRFIPNRASP